jgi:hypothetical protein
MELVLFLPPVSLTIFLEGGAGLLLVSCF